MLKKSISQRKRRKVIHLNIQSTVSINICQDLSASFPLSWDLQQTTDCKEDMLRLLKHLRKLLSTNGRRWTGCSSAPRCQLVYSSTTRQLRLVEKMSKQTSSRACPSLFTKSEKSPTSWRRLIGRWIIFILELIFIFSGTNGDTNFLADSRQTYNKKKSASFISISSCFILRLSCFEIVFFEIVFFGWNEILTDWDLTLLIT